MVEDCKRRLDYAQRNSDLPAEPDYRRIREFVMTVNEKTVRMGE